MPVLHHKPLALHELVEYKLPYHFLEVTHFKIHVWTLQRVPFYFRNQLIGKSMQPVSNIDGGGHNDYTREENIH